MKRRHFVGTATAASGGLLAQRSYAQSNSAAVDGSAPLVQWRMATSWPKSLDIVFGSVDAICRHVSTVTDGRFTITPYAADEIVAGLNVMDAVAAGTVECGHTASYYYIDKTPALAFATTVPFGLNAQQQIAWLMSAGGLESIQRLYADYGIINFPAGSTGAQMGGWFKQQINSVTELQGLKMRIPGLGGQVMERLGIDVRVLAGNEIFEQLEQNLIDAAEWVGPYEDEKLGLNRIAPYYYYPGWWEPGTTYEVQINLSAWQQLPLEYQEALRSAALESHTLMLAKYDAANGESLQRLIMSGTSLLPYSPEILRAAKQEAFALYEDTASQDADFRKIYTQWRTFRAEIYGWNQANELSLAQFID
ncbi:ABC transporter substrate-binding protein [Sphaerothrix gracilis]|uniref:TRAP transporter substrate-binding protein n=1 Tax=Sphaerothrix gracilis TaxID=3151835 RepID=UPI0031FC4839